MAAKASISKGIGVKFSTNGAFIDADKARRLAAMDYLDSHFSLDGTDAVTNAGDGGGVGGSGLSSDEQQACGHSGDGLTHGVGPFDRADPAGSTLE